MFISRQLILATLTGFIGSSSSLLARGAVIEERDFLSDITSIFGDVTSVAVSIFGDATSIAPGVFETITSEAGSIFTVVTSEGGEAITLAESEAGRVTSFAGHEFTIATNAVVASATSNSALRSGGLLSLGFTPVATAGFLMVVGGILVGALIAV